MLRNLCYILLSIHTVNGIFIWMLNSKYRQCRLDHNDIILRIYFRSINVAVEYLLRMHLSLTTGSTFRFLGIIFHVQFHGDKAQRCRIICRIKSEMLNMLYWRLSGRIIWSITKSIRNLFGKKSLRKWIGSSASHFLRRNLLPVIQHKTTSKQFSFPSLWNTMRIEKIRIDFWKRSKLSSDEFLCKWWLFIMHFGSEKMNFDFGT